MAEWVTHLMIADKVLGRFSRLDGIYTIPRGDTLDVGRKNLRKY